MDKPVYLIDHRTNSGVGIEAYSNWDYVRLADVSGKLADRVIFHRQGNGFIIEHTTGHWDGYRYWHSDGTGVKLNDRAHASVFRVGYERGHEKEGLVIVGPKFGAPLNSQHDGKSWLKEQSSPGHYVAHFHVKS
ncbi:hypothetical protein [Streptomyces globisporus]|uniref:hypothetical protein n=1 Tax=Streptomyces globisporus TaxID=1908 RepID=UPI00378F1EE5